MLVGRLTFKLPMVGPAVPEVGLSVELVPYQRLHVLQRYVFHVQRYN